MKFILYKYTILLNFILFSCQKREALNNLEVSDKLVTITYSAKILKDELVFRNACLNIPNNLDEAIVILKKHLPLDILQSLKYAENVSSSKTEYYKTWVNHAHHGLGRFLRNHWLYKKNSPLVIFFIKEKDMENADDISMYILEKLTQEILDKKFNVNDEIKKRTKGIHIIYDPISQDQKLTDAQNVFEEDTEINKPINRQINKPDK